MGASFRLMTANLLHERCDAADFTRVVERMSPDVVVTQELGPQCADILASAYPHHRLTPALGYLGRGIATRFDADFDVIAMPGRPGTSALLEVDGVQVRVAGVHLLNPVQFPWWRQVRIRREQLSSIMRWLDEDDDGRPVVVAGDFNASPRWPAYHQMVGRLDDLVADRAEREGLGPERTWSWRPGWRRLLRIDHVFGSGVQARDVEVVHILGSDHHAVVVDLEVAG